MMDIRDIYNQKVVNLSNITAEEFATILYDQYWDTFVPLIYNSVLRVPIHGFTKSPNGIVVRFNIGIDSMPVLTIPLFKLFDLSDQYDAAYLTISGVLETPIRISILTLNETLKLFLQKVAHELHAKTLFFIRSDHNKGDRTLYFETYFEEKTQYTANDVVPIPSVEDPPTEPIEEEEEDDLPSEDTPPIILPPEEDPPIEDTQSEEEPNEEVDVEV
jgi:hypothetical protein